jgi:hypothetical protein
VRSRLGALFFEQSIDDVLGAAKHDFSFNDVSQVLEVARHQKFLALWLLFTTVFLAQLLIDISKVPHINTLSMHGVCHALRVCRYTIA